LPKPKKGGEVDILRLDVCVAIVLAGALDIRLDTIHVVEKRTSAWTLSLFLKKAVCFAEDTATRMSFFIKFYKIL
jgi:hypothetical protein